jgi:HK97 family phage major capsid protein
MLARELHKQANETRTRYVPDEPSLGTGMAALAQRVDASILVDDSAAPGVWSASDRVARAIPETLKGRTQFSFFPGRRDRLYVSFAQLARSLGTVPGSKGGYLVESEVGTPAAALFGDSIAGSLGVTVIGGLSQVTTIPRPSTMTGTWIGEASSASLTDPSLGSVTIEPKTLSVRTQVSKQLITQAPGAGDLLGRLMARAAVKALDAALLSGAGGVEPLGIANATGIQTQSGSSLNLSGILAAQYAVVAAGSSDQSLSFVSTPGIRQTLAARETVSTSGLMVWRLGRVADIPAYVSVDCPSSTAILGDFRNQCAIALFGNAAEISIDSSSGFDSATLTYRLKLLADIVIFQSAAFCKVSSIS